MSEFVETTIELMKSHSVDIFMKETIQRKDDPAGLLADLWHYCERYALDFFNIVADGELGPQKVHMKTVHLTLCQIWLNGAR
jgi:hypothetical protein